MSCVLITGATSGIGLQLAKDYADSGWNVVACGRNTLALQELEAYSPLIVGAQFELTDLEQIKLVISRLELCPELWIFNAGDCEYIDDGEIDAALIKRVFSVNVIGLANSLEACQPYFKPGQRIAIVGSIASEIALPRAEAYGASKAAVSYLARTLQLDLKGKGIAVSVIYPGFVKTPLTDKNTFPMPMLITAEQASQAIRRGLEKRKPHIYFPTRFTAILRFIGVLPYRWQNVITSKLVSR